MVGDLVRTTVVTMVLSVPLGLSIWALLDAAQRPHWVWAFAARRRVVWMAAIGLGIATVIGGLLISGYYLTRIRTELARVEDGHLDG